MPDLIKKLPSEIKKNKLKTGIFLGCLVRIIFNPIVFLPRYLMAFKLFFLVWSDNVNNK